MRLYSEANVMKYAVLSSSTATQNGYSASNLLTQAPRTTSSARTPNGSSAKSCAIFTSFPVVMTFDLTGSAFVKYMLVVGNADDIVNFSDFRLYVGQSSDYS